MIKLFRWSKKFSQEGTKNKDGLLYNYETYKKRKGKII
jgi:hypothetical protein